MTCSLLLIALAGCSGAASQKSATTLAWTPREGRSPRLARRIRRRGPHRCWRHGRRWPVRRRSVRADLPTPVPWTPATPTRSTGRGAGRASSTPARTCTRRSASRSAERKAIPIRHVIVFMQENRSFDHYFGRLTHYGHPVDGFPADFSNPTARAGRPRRGMRRRAASRRTSTTAGGRCTASTTTGRSTASTSTRPRTGTGGGRSSTSTSATSPSTTGSTASSRWRTGTSARCSGRPGRTATTSTRRPPTG